MKNASSKPPIREIEKLALQIGRQQHRVRKAILTREQKVAAVISRHAPKVIDAEEVVRSLTKEFYELILPHWYSLCKKGGKTVVLKCGKIEIKMSRTSVSFQVTDSAMAKRLKRAGLNHMVITKEFPSRLAMLRGRSIVEKKIRGVAFERHETLSISTYGERVSFDTKSLKQTNLKRKQKR